MVRMNIKQIPQSHAIRRIVQASVVTKMSFAVLMVVVIKIRKFSKEAQYALLVHVVHPVASPEENVAIWILKQRVNQELLICPRILTRHVTPIHVHQVHVVNRIATVLVAMDLIFRVLLDLRR